MEGGRLEHERSDGRDPTNERSDGREPRGGGRLVVLRTGSVEGALAALATVGAAVTISVLALPVLAPAASILARARVGVLYALAFHRVALSVPGHGEVAVGLFLGAVPAAVWLFAVGRRRASGLGEAPGARAVAGAAAAPAYGAVFLGLALLPPPAAGGIAGTDAEVLLALRPVLWQAFLLPLAMAAIAGAAGALAPIAREAAPGPRRSVVAALLGGWRMLLSAVGLALAGILLLAAVRPDGSAAYLRAIGSRGPGTAAVVLAHHALLLPSEGLWILVPSMGGCDLLRLEGRTVELLCLGRLPGGGGDAAPRGAALYPDRILDVADAGRPAPFGYRLFVLVPLIASVAGGWRSAAWGRPRSVAEAVAHGTGAGLVFTALVAVGAALSWIAVLDAAAGPQVPVGAGLALAWGVVGGGVGAVAARTVGRG